jgi:hypothetical protein
MKKALISIDYTYDFVANDGKLTAGKPAQAIEEAIILYGNSVSKLSTERCKIDVIFRVFSNKFGIFYFLCVICVTIISKEFLFCKQLSENSFIF